MKKLLSILALLLFSIAVHAQKQITHFLGIPVDGSKEEMIQKLEEKGLIKSLDHDYSVGEFNGRDVEVHIVTNRNKVWRIAVFDTQTHNETGIRIQFNDLCRQFDKNPKYTSLRTDYTIPEDEDISYQMSVKNKRYQAAYYQKSSDGSLDGLELLNRRVWFTIGEYFGRYKIILYYDNVYNQANGEDL